MTTDRPSLSEIIQPSAPILTAGDLWGQFCTDIQGKDVQMTASWSYTWMADQLAHICIGMMLHFVLAGILGHFAMTAEHADWVALIGIALIVTLWEWRAYQDTVKQTTGRFPLNADDLKDNAVIATVYMVLGVIAGYGFHQSFWVSVGVFIVVAGMAVWLARPWLRQHITWQKAGLPYLFRLANATTGINRKDADRVQNFLESGAPPEAVPAQIIIHGPIGAGRTSLAIGIATETAFRKRKARYISMDKLLETAALETDDQGPWNVNYWPWRESQLMVIDDISTDLDATEEQSFQLFEARMRGPMAKAWPALQARHTVWVLGDTADPARWVRVITEACGSRQEAIVVGLT